MNNKFLEDNILILLVVVVVVIGGIVFASKSVPAAISSFDSVKTKQESLKNKQSELVKIQEQVKKKEQEAQAGEEESTEQKQTKSGKIIYEVLEQQFSPEASFGIMFENILSNITNSGVKVRKIEYNYNLTDDKIASSGAVGYNACELSFVTVANYSQLQAFFKNIAKENYLSNIYEVYIEPYDRDKTILIAKFKIRLYTKTI